MGDMADEHIDRLYSEECEYCGDLLIDCLCDQGDMVAEDFPDWLVNGKVTSAGSQHSKG